MSRHAKHCAWQRVDVLGETVCTGKGRYCRSSDGLSYGRHETAKERRRATRKYKRMTEQQIRNMRLTK